MCLDVIGWLNFDCFMMREMILENLCNSAQPYICLRGTSKTVGLPEELPTETIQPPDRHRAHRYYQT